MCRTISTELQFVHVLAGGGGGGATPRPCVGEVLRGLGFQMLSPPQLFWPLSLRPGVV